MKYEVEVRIDLPRSRVIELFDDPENLPKWQEGLIQFELIEGEPGLPGAKSRLLYEMNGRKIEMVETITRRDLPEIFAGTYEAKGVWNAISNRFLEDGPQATRWIVDSEFRFQGLMKVMGWLMPGSFPKQTRKSMEDFKNFAESQG